MLVTTVILVLACKGYPWEMLENEGIRKTWYAKRDGLDIIFYYGNAKNNYFAGDRLFLRCGEGYENTGKKTVLAFEQVLLKYPNLKYIFRTNLSSYIRLDKLMGVLGSFGTSQIYAGIVGNHFGITFASGCGYFLSRDLMELLIVRKNELEFVYMDDVCIGKFLTGMGVHVLSMPRFDITSMSQLDVLKREDIDKHFHFRCKQASDRKKDVEVMRRLCSFFQV